MTKIYPIHVSPSLSLSFPSLSSFSSFFHTFSPSLPPGCLFDGSVYGKGDVITIQPCLAQMTCLGNNLYSAVKQLGWVKTLSFFLSFFLLSFFLSILFIFFHISFYFLPLYLNFVLTLYLSLVSFICFYFDVDMKLTFGTFRKKEI